MRKGEGRDEGENDNGAAAQRQKAGGEFCHRVRQRTQLEERAKPGEANYEVVALNGKRYKIMRGVEVRVPVCVAEVLENAAMMAEAARRYVDERAS